MKIIDTVKQPGYTQWIGHFVERIIADANILAEEVVILEMHAKLFYLAVDGSPYLVQTYNYFPADKDENGMTCSENVEYTLYSSHTICGCCDYPHTANKVSEGILNVAWVNDAALFAEEVRVYKEMHPEYSQRREPPKEGEYITLKMHDLIGGSCEMQVDLRDFKKEDIAPTISCLLTGSIEEKHTTASVLRHVKAIINTSAYAMTNFCFDDDFFDQEYTCCLIAKLYVEKPEYKNLITEELMYVMELSEAYENGDPNAINNLKGNLYEFFCKTAPFYFTEI